MLAADSTPAVPLRPDDFPNVIPVEGSPYVRPHCSWGEERDHTIRRAFHRASGRRTPWRKLVDVDDAVVAADFHGSDVYLLTHKDAPRFKVLRIRADAPDLGEAEVVVPEGSSACSLRSRSRRMRCTCGSSRAVWAGCDGCPSASESARGCSCPSNGAISTIVVDRRKPGVVFPLESWTRSRLWYQYTPGQPQPSDTRLVAPAKVDVSDYESVEIEVPSHDGVKVPLSIVYRKGIKKDGNPPAAAWMVTAPTASPTIPTSARRGWPGSSAAEFFAVAHVRGGGEYGEDWHQAGRRRPSRTPGRTSSPAPSIWSKEGYTSPEHLAGTGGSAGGILIGRAITERPDLFRPRCRGSA